MAVDKVLLWEHGGIAQTVLTTTCVPRVIWAISTTRTIHSAATTFPGEKGEFINVKVGYVKATGMRAKATVVEGMRHCCYQKDLKASSHDDSCFGLV